MDMVSNARAHDFMHVLQGLDRACMLRETSDASIYGWDKPFLFQGAL